MVDHVDVAWRCTCPSRKQPCKHALALLLLGVRDGVPGATRPEFLEAGLALDPGQLELRYGAALVKAALNDLPGAIQDLEKTLEIQPDHPGARRNLPKARALLKSKKNN